MTPENQLGSAMDGPAKDSASVTCVPAGGSPLRSSAASGIGWTTFEAACRWIVQLVSAILLARLLDPMDFGLFGMLIPFAILGAPVVEAGLAQALVQSPELSEADTSSAFYINLLLGAGVAAALFASAPLIAAFYGQPKLNALMRALSLTFLAGATIVVPNALLYRAFRFGVLSKMAIVSNFLAVAASVAAAFRGWGVWSLVAHNVVQSASSGLMAWIVSPWRPRLLFDRRAGGRLLRFGSRLQAALVLNLIFDRLSYVVIGKMYSAADLGYYTRAHSVQQLPAANLTGILTRVAFPVFARVSADPAATREVLRSTLLGAAFVTVPAMLGLAAVADTLVAALFGVKWLPCVPYLRVLCIAGLFAPVQEIHLSMILASGRPSAVLRLEMLRKALLVLALALTFRFGLLAIAWGYAVAVGVSCVLLAHYGGRLTGHSLVEQFRTSIPYVAAASVMGGVVVSVAGLSSLPGAAKLLLQVAGGAGAYWLICHRFRLEGYRKAVELLKASPVGTLLSRRMRIMW